MAKETPSRPDDVVVAAFKKCTYGKACDRTCPYYKTQYRCDSKQMMQDVIIVLENREKTIERLRETNAGLRKAFQMVAEKGPEGQEATV